MKTIYAIILIIILLASWLTAQQNDYWKNATVSGKKIYSISLSDQQNGYAVSADDEFFITKDGGVNWKLNSDKIDFTNSVVDKNYWSADIYCSVMQSTDGGESWIPYSGERQDHFCKVYLKDPNVDYKTASEFLSKVTINIVDKISCKKIDDLINQPTQCTEYYCNENDGWALGWCVKNFRIQSKQ